MYVLIIHSKHTVPLTNFLYTFAFLYSLYTYKPRIYSLFNAEPWSTTKTKRRKKDKSHTLKFYVEYSGPRRRGEWTWSDIHTNGLDKDTRKMGSNESVPFLLSFEDLNIR